MIEKLKSQPNDMLAFQDEEAKTLIFELGFIDQFTSNLPIGPIDQLAAFTTNDTHWVAAALYSGRDDLNENGFVAFCYPKSTSDFSGFRLLFSQQFSVSPENILKIRGFRDQDGRN